MTKEDISMDRIRNVLSRLVYDTPTGGLPYDCPRRAHARLLEDQTNGFDYAYHDLLTVLGEPNSGITIPQTEMEIREYFMKSVEESQERAKFLKATEDSRIKERRKMYVRAGKYLGSD